jgi:hypothetical protein
MLPMVDSQRVVGVHLSGTGASTPFGPALELDGLSPADRGRAQRFNRFPDEGLGYLTLQSTRPQTLAYSLNDSPVGVRPGWLFRRDGSPGPSHRRHPDFLPGLALTPGAAPAFVFGAAPRCSPPRPRTWTMRRDPRSRC